MEIRQGEVLAGVVKYGNREDSSPTAPPTAVHGTARKQRPRVGKSKMEDVSRPTLHSPTRLNFFKN